MKGTNLGEFEEVVLLTIASLMDEAYSVNIVDEIEKVTGRATKLGVVHAVLKRLEDKGYISSELGEPTKERGGRRKRFFKISHSGKVSLLKAREQRDQLWNTIPDVVFEGLIGADKRPLPDGSTGCWVGTADQTCWKICRETCTNITIETCQEAGSGPILFT